MSWLTCDDCGEFFNAKDGNEWRADLGNEWIDNNLHITCWKCLQDEEALTSAEYDELQETDAKS